MHSAYEAQQSVDVQESELCLTEVSTESPFSSGAAVIVGIDPVSAETAPRRDTVAMIEHFILGILGVLS